MDNKRKGSYASNSTYSCNKKTPSNIQQEAKKKSHKRDAKHPDGKCAALTEMLHLMLHYPEVYTNLIFVSICTMPL